MHKTIVSVSEMSEYHKTINHHLISFDPNSANFARHRDKTNTKNKIICLDLLHVTPLYLLLIKMEEI